MNDPLNSIICLRPFYSLELNIKGDVSACCPAWSKRMVGNVRKKSPLEIWNDRPLREMRRMMLEGRWEKICRPNCPTILNYRLSKQTVSLTHATHLVTNEILAAVRSRQTVLSTDPTWLNFANSNHCNLNCIMCGREHYKDDAQLIAKIMAEVKELLPGLREIFLTGNGDPFARPDTRDLLLNLDGSSFPQLKINLLTNGLLLPKYWDKIRHLNFGDLDISVDAATQQTYQTIRRGGNWRDLLKALEIASGSRDRFRNVVINMTVMKENYREIEAFVELASRYGFTVGINKIRGKWGKQNIFTGGEPKVLEELRRCIVSAQQKAQKLNVPFNCSGFNDILTGKTIPSLHRYKQILMDNLVQVYYRLKP